MHIMRYINGLSLARWHDRILCPFPLKINPYRGCEYNCTYCYLEKTRRIKKYPNKVEPADLNQIKKYFNEINDGLHDSYIHRCLNMKLPLQIGTTTDPFQHVENKYKNTKKILKLLNKYEYPFILITKGLIPHSYYKYFNDKSCIHYTLTTTNENIRKKIEPGTPTTEKKLKNIQDIINNDLNINIRIWPVIPLVTDPENVIKTIADMGGTHVITSIIRLLNYKTFMDKFNKSINTDYIKYLKNNNICINKELDQIMICKEEKNKIHERLYKLAYHEGLNYFSPNIPQPNNSCCGVDDIFGDVGSWSIKKRYDQIHNKTFNDYIKNTGCPFPEWFERHWNQGKISEFIYDLYFDPIHKKYFYKKTKQEVLL